MFHSFRIWLGRFGLGIIGFAATSTLASAQVGDLAKLKIYRNYYTIDLDTPEAHQIQVWYKKQDEMGFEQWSRVNVAIQADQDLSKLTKEDFVNIQIFTAGWPQPPENPTAIPPELEPQRAHLEMAIKRIFADEQLSDFLLVYRGYRAKVDVSEHIPFYSAEGTWVGKEAEKEFFVDIKNRSMEEISSSGSGYGLVFYRFETEEQVNQIKWLDFGVSPEIVGSSILTLDHDEEKSLANPSHLEAHQNLLDRVLASAVAMQSGETVHSSLADILAKQGDQALPEGLKQNFQFEVVGIGRVPYESTAEQLRIVANFVLQLSEQPIAMTKIDEASGFKISLTGKLVGTSPALNIQICSAQGLCKKAKAKIKTEAMKIVRSGSEIMAPFVSLDWGRTKEIKFPGVGEYSAFEFFPHSRQELLPTNLTGDLEVK